MGAILGGPFLQPRSPLRDISKTYTRWRHLPAIGCVVGHLVWPFLKMIFSLECSWCAMLGLLQVYSKVNQVHTHICSLAKWPHSCPALCDPMDCSPSGSSVPGILQVRILEWVAMASSRGSSWPRDPIHVSCTCSQILYCWATREASHRWCYWASLIQGKKRCHFDINNKVSYFSLLYFPGKWLVIYLTSNEVEELWFSNSNLLYKWQNISNEVLPSAQYTLGGCLFFIFV